MAYTKTDYELAAGFSDVDVLDKLGEVFFGLGLMDSATGWFDSFTDTNGSEVRILEIEYTGNVGVYNKVYHAFFMGSAFGGLWYTVYYSWDVSVHESTGVNLVDHVGTYKHPDAITGWSNYYAGLSQMPNASAFTISTYEDGGNIPLMVFTAPGESRVYAFIPGDSVLKGTDDYSDYGPAPLYTLGVGSQFYMMGALVSTDRSVTGRSDYGNSSDDWQLSTTYGSHYSGGSITTGGLSAYMPVTSLTGIPGINVRSPRRPYYTIARGLPSVPGYYDASLGVNLGLVAGENDNAFIPANGDNLIISAGVEEYKVLIMKTSTLSSYDWQALIARTV
jgi:hypothetical protein